jgi:hypothetical membrane protein
MKTKFMLSLGSLIPVVFFATTIICGFIMGDYNHLIRMVSELGAIGTPSQYVFSAGLVVCSALSVVFVVGIFRVCKESGLSVIPAIIILSYTISIAGAGIFPLPLRLHLIMGFPSTILFLSPLMSLFLWSREKNLPYIKIMSIVGFLIMSLGFLAFMPEFLSNYSGLKQRLFHIGWSVWFIYLSYSFINLLKSNYNK